MIDKINFVHL